MYTPEDIAQALERLAPRMLYLDRSPNPEQAQQQLRESLSLVELMAFVCAKRIASTGGDEFEEAERAAAGLNKLLAAGIDPERLAVEVQESIGSLESVLYAESEWMSESLSEAEQEILDADLDRLYPTASNT